MYKTFIILLMHVGTKILCLCKLSNYSKTPPKMGGHYYGVSLYTKLVDTISHPKMHYGATPGNVLTYLGMVGMFRSDDPILRIFNLIGSLFYTSTQSN